MGTRIAATWTRWLSVVAGLVVAGAAFGSEVPSARAVRFAINPSGARLLVDDRKVSWFGQTLTLSPGEHRIEVDVPDSRCCVPIQRTVVVHAPAERSDAKGTDGKAESGGPPQVVAIHMLVRPADVVLVGAPAGASICCDELDLVAASGELATVALPQVAWDGRCRFRAPDGRYAEQQHVRLRAGEVNAIRWPGMR